MLGQFSNRELARAAARRSAEVRRKKAELRRAEQKAEQGKAGLPNRSLPPADSASEQESIYRELDALALQALRKRFEQGKAPVADVLDWFQWRGIRPPRQEFTGELEEAIKSLIRPAAQAPVQPDKPSEPELGDQNHVPKTNDSETL